MVRKLGKAILRCTYLFQRRYIRSREEFPHILNALGLLGEGIEIGVQSGYFSEVILKVWRGSCLHSVDPWRTLPSADYLDIANVTQEAHDRFYDTTVARLRRFGKRSKIVRNTSVDASALFSSGQLDFVYLDAQHSYEGVKADLHSWAAKVRTGGILAGHDYVDGILEQGVFGVKSAVDEFARDHNARVVISREKDWPSWFLFLA